MFGLRRRARPPRLVDPDLSFLRTSLWASVVVAVVTALGGFAAHSVSVLADASEKANDIVSSALGVHAENQGTDRHRRLAALVNALSLSGISLFMAGEGVARLLNPAQVDATFMTATAATAIAANTVIAMRAKAGREAVRRMLRRVLHPRSAGAMEDGVADQSVSVRGLLVDAFSDIAVSASVLAAAGLTALTGVSGIDAALSIGIAAWIGGHNAVPLLRQSLRAVRELPPRGVDPAAVAARLAAVPGVLGVEGLRVTGDRENALRLEGRVAIDPARLDARDLGPALTAAMGGAAQATYFEPGAVAAEPGPVLAPPVPRVRARSPRRSLDNLLGEPPPRVDPRRLALEILSVEGVADVFELETTGDRDGREVVRARLVPAPGADPLRLPGRVRERLAQGRDPDPPDALFEVRREVSGPLFAGRARNPAPTPPLPAGGPRSTVYMDLHPALGPTAPVRQVSERRRLEAAAGRVGRGLVLDLRDMDLRNLRLSDVTLPARTLASGSNVTGADLRRSHLRDHDLRFLEGSRAKVRGRDPRLWPVELSGADISGSDASFAHLPGARLRDTRARYVTADHAVLDGVDAAGICLDRARARRVSAVGAGFEQASATYSNWTGSAISRVRFEDANVAGSSFAGARLDEGIFDGAICLGTIWDGARLGGARFHRAVVDETTVESLREAGAQLEDVRVVDAETAAGYLRMARLQPWRMARELREHLGIEQPAPVPSRRPGRSRTRFARRLPHPGHTKEVSP